jgi:hypothetical protein
VLRRGQPSGIAIGLARETIMRESTAKRVDSILRWVSDKRMRSEMSAAVGVDWRQLNRSINRMEERNLGGDKMIRWQRYSSWALN